MIELGRRARDLPAPPHVVFESLTDLTRLQARRWLVLLEDEVAPRVLRSDAPHTVVWSSLWPSRPHDEIHLRLSTRDLAALSSSQTMLEFTLFSPDEEPDASKLGHLRKRLNHLLFADLRFSYGQ